MPALINLFMLTLVLLLAPTHADAVDDGHYLMYFSVFTNETTAIRFDGETWDAIQAYNEDKMDYSEMLQHFYHDKKYPRFEVFRGILPLLLPLPAEHRELTDKHGYRESAGLRLQLDESVELYIALANPYRAEHVNPERLLGSQKPHPLGTLTWVNLSSDEIKKRTSILTMNRDQMDLGEFERCQSWLKGDGEEKGRWRLLRFAR